MDHAGWIVRFDSLKVLGMRSICHTSELENTLANSFSTCTKGKSSEEKFALGKKFIKNLDDNKRKSDGKIVRKEIYLREFAVSTIDISIIDI